MTDRELLEMAATAAGLDTSHWWNADRLLMDPPVNALRVNRDGKLMTTGWDPLTDDGQALRLAVQLGMELSVDDDAMHCAFAYARISGAGEDPLFEPVVDDACKALRRAIVRAAAEVGKGLEQQRAVLAERKREPSGGWPDTDAERSAGS